MLKTLGKKIYLQGLSLLQADKLKIKALQRQDKLIILNLHRVSPKANAFWPPLSPEVFRGLLSFLKRHFYVCRLDEVADQQADMPSVVLSFDDGYSDFIEYSMPIMEEFGFSANLNVIPECAETGRPMWNIRLYDFLHHAPDKLLSEIDLPGFDEKLDSDDATSKLRFGLKISRFLKNRSRIERKELFVSLDQLMTKLDFPSTRMLSTDEIQQILHKVELGVHSYCHESMGFEDMSFFKDDFDACVRYFVERLDEPLRIYAFPNGSYTEEQVAFLYEKNIDHVLLVGEKITDKERSPFHRLTMYGESRREICMRALGLV